MRCSVGAPGMGNPAYCALVEALDLALCDNLAERAIWELFSMLLSGHDLPGWLRSLRVQRGFLAEDGTSTVPSLVHLQISSPIHIREKTRMDLAENV